MPDKQPDFYRVVMRSKGLTPDGKDAVHEAVDPHVPAAIVDAYVADARARWQHVEATPAKDKPKADTVVPAHIKAGKSLHQHLHDHGVKHISDPTNGPGVLTAAPTEWSN